MIALGLHNQRQLLCNIVRFALETRHFYRQKENNAMNEIWYVIREEGLFGANSIHILLTQINCSKLGRPSSKSY